MIQNLIEEVTAQYGVTLSHRYVEKTISTNPSATPQFLFSNILKENLSDVVGESALPYGIASQSNAVIPKNILLQISSSRDATQPLRLSADMSEEEAAVMASDQKFSSKRLLRLVLTDGVASIVGVELTTLPNFSGIPIPGEKIRVKAGSEVKSGVIVFTPDNIELLGGEVKELKQEFLDHRRRMQSGYQTSTGIDGAPKFEPLAGKIDSIHRYNVVPGDSHPSREGNRGRGGPPQGGRSQGGGKHHERARGKGGRGRGRGDGRGSHHGPLHCRTDAAEHFHQRGMNANISSGSEGRGRGRMGHCFRDPHQEF